MTTQLLEPAVAPEMAGPRRLAYCAGALANQLAFGVPLMFLPLLLESRFHAGPAVIGTLMTMMPAAGLVMLPAANALGDRLDTPLGRRLPLMLIGAPLVTAGLAGAAVAPHLSWLAASIVATFVGVNLFVWPYRASLADEVALADYDTVSGLQAMFKGIGMLGVLAGGGWLYRFGPGVPFAVASALYLPLAIALMATLRARQRPEGPPPPVSVRPYLDVLSAFPALWGVHLAAWAAVHACLAFTVLFYVHDLLHIPALGSSAGKAATAGALPLMTLFALTSMVAAVLLGRRAQAHGERATLFAGLGAIGAGVLVGLAAQAPWQVYAFAVLGGIGFAAIQVLPYPMMLARLDARQAGALAALFEVAINLAQLVALPLLGWLIACTGTYRAAYAAAFVALALAAWLLSRVRPSPKNCSHGA